MKDPQDWVRELRLARHPEGGYYRETYRSERVFGDRACSTAIYFLLPAGEISALHRIHSDELWHFYAGRELMIHIIHPNGRYEKLPVGPMNPQAIVPAGCWFGATVEEGYALVGCTVSPGFDFADFEMGQRMICSGNTHGTGRLSSG